MGTDRTALLLLLALATAASAGPNQQFDALRATDGSGIEQLDGANLQAGSVGETALSASVRSNWADRVWFACYLDIDPIAEGGWCDFEIKFSTNNFTNLVYYYKSTGTNSMTVDGYSIDDPDPYVYYTASGGHTNGVTDSRVWHKQIPHEAIYFTLADPTNGVVGGIEFWASHECEFPWTRWMFEGNVKLVGSWMRIDSVGTEQDGASRDIWRSVEILGWSKERRTR